jgi:hypothetical protein
MLQGCFDTEQKKNPKESQRYQLDTEINGSVQQVNQKLYHVIVKSFGGGRSIKLLCFLCWYLSESCVEVIADPCCGNGRSQKLLRSREIISAS